MSSEIEVHESTIADLGVFAVRDISCGGIVYTFPKGRVVALSGLVALAPEDLSYVNEIGDNVFEVIEPPARYINHSCDPNVLERSYAGYALRTIKKGEEITIDYEKVAWAGDPFECHCGSDKCRGQVSSARSRNG